MKERGRAAHSPEISDRGSSILSVDYDMQKRDREGGGSGGREGGGSGGVKSKRSSSLFRTRGEENLGRETR